MSTTDKVPTEAEQQKQKKLAEREARKLAYLAKKEAEEKAGVAEASQLQQKLTKAQRREIQEAQRALKAQKQAAQQQQKGQKPAAQQQKLPQQQPSSKSPAASQKGPTNENKTPAIKADTTIKSTSSSISNKNSRKGQLFAHIACRNRSPQTLTAGIDYDGLQLHPQMIRVGLQMNQDQLHDSNSRLVAFLCAFRAILLDYKSSTDIKQISRDLEAKLDACTSFLDSCRPLSIGLRNVIRILRKQITRLPLVKSSEQQTNEQLCELVDDFLHEEIECGMDGIKEHGAQKVHDGDLILVYGSSLLVRQILGKASAEGRQFRVIVVDSHPRLRGRHMFDYLVKQGIETTYVLISTIAHIIGEVSKVVLEAETLLANGYMIAEMGSSQVALVAKSHNVPVLVCCETFKFSERVHTDSFVYNEAAPIEEFFGNSDESTSLKAHMQKQQNAETCNSRTGQLSVLNLLYDITSPDFISMVITEMGNLPCTAVPAIVRRNICKFHLES